MIRSIFICGVFVLKALQSEAIVTVKFTQVNCSTSAKGTCIGLFCRIDQVNRDMTSLNIGCKKLQRTLNKVQVKYNFVYKRKNGNYQQLMKTDWIEFCTQNDGDSFLEFMRQWVFPKGVDKKCPLKNEDFQINNLTFTPRTITIFPPGVFRFASQWKDEEDDKVFAILGSLETRIKT